jgi:hypothetical protein
MAGTAVRLRRAAAGFGARLRGFFGIGDLSKLTYHLSF